MSSNLPTNTEITDSAEKTKLVFNNSGDTPTEFRAIDVDTTIAFFQKRDFSDDAAESVAIMLLTQAKKEKISVRSILESIDKTNDVQLSVFVSKILNADRVQTSVLGYREPVTLTTQTRNILE